MAHHIRSIVVLSLSLVTPAVAASGQHPAMPAGMTHEQHQAQLAKERELKRRGALAMGFDQDTTTHHFRLYATGGAIEVAANDPADAAGVTAIRLHLREIAAEFAAGQFGKPFATHGEVPPGVRTMEERKSAISFVYEDMPAGGRVRITAADAASRRAVHEFLRYQIQEHATGDPVTVAK
jgi:hypothetical protein